MVLRCCLSYQLTVQTLHLQALSRQQLFTKLLLRKDAFCSAAAPGIFRRSAPLTAGPGHWANCLVLLCAMS